MRFNINRKKLFYLSLIYYFGSLVVIYFDYENFYYLWVEILLQILSVIFFLLSLDISFNSNSWRLNLSSIFKKNKLFLLYSLVVILVNFLFISEYPFNSIGDELRDGGIVTANVLDGYTKNIWGYGPYNGYGLNVQIMSLPFEFLFHHNTLSFKVACAFYSSLELIMLFYLIRKVTTKKIAFVAGIIALSVPIHLYYSRTEPVVLYSSFVTTAFLLILYNFFKNPTLKNVGICGLLVGFSLGLHSAVRPLDLIIFITVIIYLFKRRHFQFIPIFILAVMIGFGPRILFITPEALANTNKIIIKSETILSNLLNSWGVYFLTPTTTHYFIRAPILNKLYAFLFVIGLIALFKKINWYKALILLLLFTMPIFDSAITDFPNSDHRLLLLVPISVVAISYGIDIVFSFFKDKVFNILYTSAILIVAAAEIFFFFYSEPASKSMHLDTNVYWYQNFLTTYSIQAINNDAILNSSTTLCITGNSFEMEYRIKTHIREYDRYLIPHKDITYNVNDTVPNRTVVVSKTCADEISNIFDARLIYCQDNAKYVCPNDGNPVYVNLLYQ